MLEHGGRLHAAAQRYGIAREHWLDLSTGISPWSWLDEGRPTIPASAWSRLPEDDDALADAARRYYGADALPVAGSQAALQALPRLRSASRVAVLQPSYAEHAQAWTRAGHTVVALPADALRAQAYRFDVIVLVHPNNPDGQRWPREQLLDLQTRLSARGGWLVVDEAFIDIEPQRSLAALSAQPGLIVLRSLGKFFGLAGARVGFVLAEAALRERLQEQLGPWTLSGPARFVAAAALRDRQWQMLQRTRLQHAAQRLATSLREAGFSGDGSCALFQWTRVANAAAIHHALATQGVLVRRFEAPPGLRFGLPRDAHDEQRLRAALRVCPRPIMASAAEGFDAGTHDAINTLDSEAAAS